MLPEGWKETQPANIVAFFNGFAFKSTDTTDQGIKWLKISNVTPGGISWKECNCLPVGFCKKYRDFLVKKGDVVVALTRPIINNHLKIGRLESEDDLSLLNQRVAKIVPKNGNYLDYIYHLFRSDDFSNKIQQALLGTDPPNLSMSVLKRFLLPLPPLSEQKKIAAILSTWDCAIEGTEKLLANSLQQKKALMQQLLTGKKRLPGFTGEWKTKNLGDIANIQTGSSNRQDSLTNGEYTFFDRSEDIRTSNRYLFDCEAVIVPGEGQDFVPKYFVGKFDLHQRTYAISCFQACDGKFIFYTVGYHRSHFLSQAVGSTVKSLRLPMFQKMPLKLPPLPEQRAIAAVLTTADEEITAIESDLSRLRQEKKALMQQLLTGKRRVTVD